MSDHTLVPWTMKPRPGPSGPERSMDCAILDGHGEIIAECFEKVGRTSEGRFIERPAHANATFIVRAVNSHEALTDALAEAIYQLKCSGLCHDHPTVVLLQKALTAARTEQGAP